MENSIQLVYSPNFKKNINRNRIFSVINDQPSIEERVITPEITRNASQMYTDSQIQEDELITPYKDQKKSQQKVGPGILDSYFSSSEKQKKSQETKQWSPNKQNWIKKLQIVNYEKEVKEQFRKSIIEVKSASMKQLPSLQATQTLKEDQSSNDYEIIQKLKFQQQQKQRENDYKLKVNLRINELKGKGCGQRECKYSFFTGLAFLMSCEMENLGKWDTCGKINQLGSVWFCQKCYHKLSYELKRPIYF